MVQFKAVVRAWNQCTRVSKEWSEWSSVICSVPTPLRAIGVIICICVVAINIQNIILAVLAYRNLNVGRVLKSL